MFQLLFSKFFFAVLIIASNSGFQHGYHAGIINVPAEVLKSWIRKIKSKRLKGNQPHAQDVTTIWSTMSSMFGVGGFFGALLTGYFCERFGRKKSLFYNNFVVLAAIGILLWSKISGSYETFILGRFLAGINAGLNGGICQIYLVEIAPDHIRGAIAGMYPFFLMSSVMCSQVAGVFLGTEQNWPQMFLVALIPACIQVICLIFCPESPKHLVIGEDNESQAEKALAWLRGTRSIYDEMDKIIEEDNLVKEFHATTLKRLFTDAALKTPLILCLVLNIGQQLCGINGILSFSVHTFEAIGMNEDTAHYITIGVSAVNVLATLVGILTVDYVGRRILLLISFLGMGIDTIGLFICLVVADQNDSALYCRYLAVVFTLIFTVMYSVGCGIVPWFITAEMFNHSTRALAVAMAVAVNWLSNFVVSQAFLPLQEVIGYYIYAVFVFLDIFFFFFTHMYLPETARKSAKELMELYNYL